MLLTLQLVAAFIIVIIILDVARETSAPDVGRFAEEYTDMAGDGAKRENPATGLQPMTGHFTDTVAEGEPHTAAPHPQDGDVHEARQAQPFRFSK